MRARSQTCLFCGSGSPRVHVVATSEERPERATTSPATMSNQRLRDQVHKVDFVCSTTPAAQSLVFAPGLNPGTSRSAGSVGKFVESVRLIGEQSSALRSERTDRRGRQIGTSVQGDALQRRSGGTPLEPRTRKVVGATDFRTSAPLRPRQAGETSESADSRMICSVWIRGPKFGPTAAATGRASRATRGNLASQFVLTARRGTMKSMARRERQARSIARTVISGSSAP